MNFSLFTTTIFHVCTNSGWVFVSKSSTRPDFFFSRDGTWNHVFIEKWFGFILLEENAKIVFILSRHGSTGQSCLWKDGHACSDILYDHHFHRSVYRHHYGSDYPPGQRLKRWIRQTAEDREDQPSWCLPGPHQVMGQL